jgi:hypothetical protein
MLFSCAAFLPLHLQDLVASFRQVCTSAAGSTNPGDIDVSELVKEPSALNDAVSISLDSVIEWMEMQEELLKKEPQQPEFVFRVKPATFSGRAV